MQYKIIIIGLFLSNIFSIYSFGQNKFNAVKIVDEQVVFEYAIYFSKESSIDKSKAIEIIKAKYENFGIVDSLPKLENVVRPQIVISEIKNVAKDFVAPDIEYLKYCGRGLNEDQKKTLQASSYVLIFDFLCPQKKLLESMQKANNLVFDLMKSEDDFLWDSETRECFTKEYWKEYRLIKNNEVNLSKHITMHLYQKDDYDYCRVITLGMLKFGLPDLCIENLSCYNNVGLANLINLTAQTLHERKKINKNGQLQVDIDLLKNQELKTSLINSLVENAQRKADINIQEGTWEEGDPENVLIEIVFSKENPQVEQDQLLSKIFGAKDEVSYISHNDKILAAKERAKEKIPELYKKFNLGLPTGTHLLIKFPFENEEEQREWMWVEVVKWEKDQVKGLLQNDPHIVKKLKSGQEVEKNINEMFDYIIYYPDGTEEGNETGRIIQGGK